MKNILFVILVFIGFTHQTYAGGGWTERKGGGFFKFAQNAIFAENIFNRNGGIDELDLPFNFYTSSIYAEYGFSDRFTGIAYVPFFVRGTIANVKNRQTGEVTPGDEMNAFGDVNLGLKYGLINKGPIALSTTFILGIPSGETAGGRGKVIQSGDGEFNQLLKVEASHSFYPKPFFASVMVGFNNRTRDFSDEFHASLEVGTTINKFTGILKLYNLSSLYNGNSTADNALFSNNIEYFSFTPEVLYQVSDHFGVTSSAGFAFSGKRILAAPNLSAGVFLKW